MSSDSSNGSNPFILEIERTNVLGSMWAELLLSGILKTPRFKLPQTDSKMFGNDQILNSAVPLGLWLANTLLMFPIPFVLLFILSVVAFVLWLIYRVIHMFWTGATLIFYHKLNFKKPVREVWRAIALILLIIAAIVILIASIPPLFAFSSVHNSAGLVADAVEEEFNNFEDLYDFANKAFGYVNETSGEAEAMNDTFYKYVPTSDWVGMKLDCLSWGLNHTPDSNGIVDRMLTVNVTLILDPADNGSIVLHDSDDQLRGMIPRIVNLDSDLSGVNYTSRHLPEPSSVGPGIRDLEAMRSIMPDCSAIALDLFKLNATMQSYSGGNPNATNMNMTFGFGGCNIHIMIVQIMGLNDSFWDMQRVLGDNSATGVKKKVQDMVTQEAVLPEWVQTNGALNAIESAVSKKFMQAGDMVTLRNELDALMSASYAQADPEPKTIRDVLLPGVRDNCTAILGYVNMTELIVNLTTLDSWIPIGEFENTKLDVVDYGASLRNYRPSSITPLQADLTLLADLVTYSIAPALEVDLDVMMDNLTEVYSVWLTRPNLTELVYNISVLNDAYGALPNASGSADTSDSLDTESQTLPNLTQVLANISNTEIFVIPGNMSETQAYVNESTYPLVIGLDCMYDIVGSLRAINYTLLDLSKIGMDELVHQLENFTQSIETLLDFFNLTAYFEEMDFSVNNFSGVFDDLRNSFGSIEDTRETMPPLANLTEQLLNLSRVQNNMTNTTILEMQVGILLLAEPIMSRIPYHIESIKLLKNLTKPHVESLRDDIVANVSQYFTGLPFRFDLNLSASYDAYAIVKPLLPGTISYLKDLRDNCTVIDNKADSAITEVNNFITGGATVFTETGIIRDTAEGLAPVIASRDDQNLLSLKNEEFRENMEGVIGAVSGFYSNLDDVYAVVDYHDDGIEDGLMSRIAEFEQTVSAAPDHFELGVVLIGVEQALYGLNDPDKVERDIFDTRISLNELDKNISDYREDLDSINEQVDAYPSYSDIFNKSDTLNNTLNNMPALNQTMNDFRNFSNEWDEMGFGVMAGLKNQTENVTETLNEVVYQVQKILHAILMEEEFVQDKYDQFNNIRKSIMDKIKFLFTDTLLGVSVFSTLTVLSFVFLYIAGVVMLEVLTIVGCFGWLFKQGALPNIAVFSYFTWIIALLFVVMVIAPWTIFTKDGCDTLIPYMKSNVDKLQTALVPVNLTMNASDFINYYTACEGEDPFNLSALAKTLKDVVNNSVHQFDSMITDFGLVNLSVQHIDNIRFGILGNVTDELDNLLLVIACESFKTRYDFANDVLCHNAVYSNTILWFNLLVFAVVMAIFCVPVGLFAAMTFNWRKKKVIVQNEVEIINDEKMDTVSIEMDNTQVAVSSVMKGDQEERPVKPKVEKAPEPAPQPQVAEPIALPPSAAPPPAAEPQTIIVDGGAQQQQVAPNINITMQLPSMMAPQAHGAPMVTNFIQGEGAAGLSRDMAPDRALETDRLLQGGAPDFGEEMGEFGVVNVSHDQEPSQMAPAPVYESSGESEDEEEVGAPPLSAPLLLDSDSDDEIYTGGPPAAPIPMMENSSGDSEDGLLSD